MGLVGILVALGLLIWLAYRGWSILLLAPGAAIVAAAFAREPLLAHWTQTFMGNAAQFLAQFFPLYRIASDTMVDLGYSSKLNAERDFLSMLRDERRKAAEGFLRAHGDDLGKRSSLDLDAFLEGI